MKRIEIALLILPLLIVAPRTLLRAQTATPQQVIVIRAGRLFDSEKGILLPARDIIIKSNGIDSVGENLPVPTGARVIDLTRYTVLPGLIDAHTHLLYLEDPSLGLTSEGIRAITQEGTPLRALRGATHEIVLAPARYKTSHFPIFITKTVPRDLRKN